MWALCGATPSKGCGGRRPKTLAAKVLFANEGSSRKSVAGSDSSASKRAKTERWRPRFGVVTQVALAGILCAAGALIASTVVASI